MNPIQHLAKLRDSAKTVYDRYDGLYTELCNVADLINLEGVPVQLPWSKGELQLMEHGAAIVRWEQPGQAYIYIAVAAGDPSGRAWGVNWRGATPNFVTYRQPTPPAAWLDLVRQIYP